MRIKPIFLLIFVIDMRKNMVYHVFEAAGSSARRQSKKAVRRRLYKTIKRDVIK